MPEPTTALDIASSINGRAYRLLVWQPPAVAPPAGWPVLWVLDGSGYHGVATDMLRNCGVVGGELEPALVVSVTYPDDAIPVWMTRRWQDFSPTPPAAGFERPGALYGGLDGFLDMLEREALPLVAARWAIDRERMTLWGHSMGGLAVLHGLLTRPGSYRGWLAISPAIWWNGRVLLRQEDGFADRVAAAGAAPRVCIATGSLEQQPLARAPDGAQVALDEINRHIAEQRIVDNARELAERLRPDVAVLRFVDAQGESHMSVPFATMGVALELALPPRR